MYVCNCHGITDHHIKVAVENGCTSFRELRKTTGVATCCGQCACHAKEVLGEVLIEQRSVAFAVQYYPAALPV